MGAEALGGPGRPEPGVATAGGDQVVVRALLDDPTAVEHDHPVGRRGLAQAVWHDQGTPAAHDGGGGLFELAGAARAGFRRRFIQYDDLSGAQDNARQCQLLLLSRGQRMALVADQVSQPSVSA